MVAVAEQRLAFEVSWKDPRTDVVFAYRLFYFPETDELEMVGLQSSLHLICSTGPRERAKRLPT